MILLLTGENSFEIDRELARLVGQFDGTPEKLDGAELETSQLPDIFMGATLFASERLVIIRGLSDNSAVWQALPEWLERANSDTQVVLVEPKPDKRTKTYKALQKQAEVREFPAWNDKDRARAEQWAVVEAERQGYALTRQQARAVVQRTGVDQWRVFQAVERLGLQGSASPEDIEQLIDAHPDENVFMLFEQALKGNTARVREMISVFRLSEEPHRLLGLLSTQCVQLVALVVADKPSSQVAKDIGAHPFVLSKLAPHAEQLNTRDAKQIVQAFAEADAAIKSSSHDPWLLIERALLEVASLR